jgi:taurine transport system substrate-binding protein
MMKTWFGAALAASAIALLGAGEVLAQSKTVTIAHQDMMVPYRAAMVAKEIEKATGWTINWRKFSGGGDVVRAMASGDVKLGELGSSPIAAAVSQGLNLEVFWILDDIGDAEALVVRNGSGVTAPQDLKGKRIGVPFVSTTHFHLLFALEQFKIAGNEVRVVNMRPPEIAAAWERGDLDATFVWDPVLAKIKQSGKVLISSGVLSSWGKATFDGYVVDKTFARQNPDFMAAYVKVLAKADDEYRRNQAAWTANSPQIQAVVQITGAKPEDAVAGMALYRFPTMEQQASNAWLGGGKDGGAARALAFTSAFLKEQGRVEKVLPDYGATVNPDWVKRAMTK